MPLYMSQFSYTKEAWAALAQNPEDRSEAVGELLESMGGQLVSLYFTFGEYDGFVVFEAPDANSAASFFGGSYVARTYQSYQDHHGVHPRGGSGIHA